MKNNKEFDYNINPIKIAIASIILTLISAIFSNFGKMDYGTEFGRGVMSGSFFVIGFLILPMFVKGYRKYLWTKKSLIILFIALVINLPIGIFCLINQHNVVGYGFMLY